MTQVPTRRSKARFLRVLIPVALVLLPILTWVFIPSPMVRGLVTGLVVGPILLLGVFAIFMRRMRRKIETNLAPPPLPLGKWDFDMSAVALGGEVVDFSEFSGRILVLNFWATWCAPCVAEMPSLSRLRDATSDLEIAFACITQESQDVVQKFLKKRPLDAPIFLLEGDPPECFKSRAIPATFVLDKSGTVCLRHFGAAAWDDPSIVNFIRGLAVAPAS